MLYINERGKITAPDVRKVIMMKTGQDSHMDE